MSLISTLFSGEASVIEQKPVAAEVTPVEPVTPITTPVDPTVEPVVPVTPAVPPTPVDPIVPVTPVPPKQEVDNLPPTDKTTDAPVFDESKIFETLSEKLGRKVESYDDLKPAEVTPLNPELQAIAEWSQKTGRPLAEWSKFQKDYTKMSDIDVVRESLQLEYPNLTNEEIQLELQSYVAHEDDLDGEAAKKSLELKKKATKGREVLNALRLELDTPATLNLPKDVKENIAFAEKLRVEYEKEQESNKAYTQGISTASSAFESLPIDLGEGLTIQYLVSPEDRNALPNLISTMPHWRNADGSPNHQAVVSDAVKIKNFDAIIKLAFEQGINKGKEALLKDGGNITLDQQAAAAAQENKGTAIQVEGFREMMGGNGFKIKYGRRS